MSEQFLHGKDVARRMRRQQKLLGLRLAAQVLQGELADNQALVCEVLATNPLTLVDARRVRELRQDEARLRADLQVLRDEFEAIRARDE